MSADERAFGGVTHKCSSFDSCMCVYDPECNPSLASVRLVPIDDEALDRANEALCRFTVPGHIVPRAEMVRAVVDALEGGEDWRAKLPARRSILGWTPDA